ncbi:MAG: hypothetical protein WBB94_03725, partial [Candidatus Saccharimonadaceae bacterium]
FFALLLVFPVISLLYGAGKLASLILGTSPDWGMQLAALGAAAMPLLLLPSVVNNSLKATGELGNRVEKLSSRANGKLGKAFGETRLADINKARQQQASIRSSKARAGIATRRRGGRLNPANWVNSASAGLNRWTGERLVPEDLQEKYKRSATAIEDKEFEDGVKAAESTFGSKQFSDIEAMANDKSLNNVERTAAIRHIMAKGNFAQRRKLIESSSTMEKAQKAAVSDGLIARGDAAIYGASIADAVKAGTIKGSTETEQFVAQNIADGKVKAEAMVHDADAAALIADVVTGATGKTYTVTQTDPVTKVRSSRSLGAVDRAVVKTAADTAKTNSGTRAKVNKQFMDQFNRL